MDDVARIYPILTRQGLLRRRKLKVEIPDLDGEAYLFACTGKSEGTYNIVPTARDRLGDLDGLAAESLIVCLRMRLVSVSLGFSGAARDRQGCTWDLNLEGAVRVVDVPCFLRSCVLGLAAPELPLTKELLESWIVARIGALVKDEARRVAEEQEDFGAAVQSEVLPTRWWEQQLALWLGKEHGFAVQLTKAVWKNAEAAQAEAARERSAQLEVLVRQQEAMHRAEAEAMRLQAEYERQKARIETDLGLSHREREQELTLLELQHKKDMLEAEIQFENAHWAVQTAAKEHELAVARFEGKLREVRQIPERKAQQERIHQETLDTLAKATAVIEKLNTLDFLKSLAQKREAHQSMERLLSPEFGFTAKEMAAAGYASAEGMLLERTREKMRQNGEVVTIRKRDLQTRSIPSIRLNQRLTRDISVARIQGLRVNSSLQFEFTTRRAGFVTLVNLGTSGTLHLHVPNAFAGIREARAEVDRTYEVPGPEFLPWEKITGYRQAGPCGWEHIVLFISEEPLIEPGIWQRSVPENPIVALSEREVQGLGEKLEAVEPGSWTGAVLSFQVVG